MPITQRQIVRITEGVDGATILHLEDNELAVMTAGWIAANNPEPSGYLIYNGRDSWFAKNSLSTLPAVLVEVQRVTPAPGELIVFKLPRTATEKDGIVLSRFLQSAMPGVACLVLPEDVEILTVAAPAAEAAA